MEDKPHYDHPPQQSNQPQAGQIPGNPTTSDLTAMIISLQNDIQELKNKRVNLNTDIIGLFETVTAAPTGTPISAYGQIKLANISGTFYIYAYNTNSNSWKRVAIA